MLWNIHVQSPHNKTLSAIYIKKYSYSELRNTVNITCQIFFHAMPQPRLKLLWVNITDCLLGLGKTPVPHESHTQCCLSWLPDLSSSTARCWCNGCWCGTFKATRRSIREGNSWWSVNNDKWEKMQQQHTIWIKIYQKLKTSNSGRIWTKYVIQVSHLPWQELSWIILAS